MKSPNGTFSCAAIFPSTANVNETCTQTCKRLGYDECYGAMQVYEGGGHYPQTCGAVNKPTPLGGFNWNCDCTSAPR